MAKRIFRKGLALVLALALVCGAAAMAETLDEFCEGYNEFLPVFIETAGVDEESSDALVELLEVSYSEELTQSIELPCYASNTGLIWLAFRDEDDPFAGFSACVTGEEDNEVLALTYTIIEYFAIRLDVQDAEAVSDLAEWLLSSEEGSGRDFAGYAVSYLRRDGYLMFSIFRQ